ncbi:MAG: hypothetical protein GWN00_07955, partial [Aliifodinibius sp.]|nr:hypothetical protein [Fodinibius sp.]NIV11152.1 hypothetical protein [Fodinibius sp.]NIY24742.1 hypothetical protein [Fodinibius sp.]
MSKLEEQKAEIKEIMEGEHQVGAAIEYAESELSTELIRKYVDRFEDLLNESNLELMREFLKTFIAKIELGKKNGRKRKGREVHIHGQIPALTRIEIALP